jgi:hypothetical protein
LGAALFLHLNNLTGCQPSLFSSTRKMSCQRRLAPFAQLDGKFLATQAHPSALEKKIEKLNLESDNLAFSGLLRRFAPRNDDIANAGWACCHEEA